MLVFAVIAVTNRDMFVDSGKTVTRKAEKNLRLLARGNPAVEDFVAQLDDAEQRLALETAAYSAGADDHKRAVLARMASEMEATGKMPYRARLAALAYSSYNERDPEPMKAMLDAHGMACDSLSLVRDWELVDDYVSMLEQAHADPVIWPFVKDDPIALILWQDLPAEDAPRALQFYHKNRDWLRAPLSLLDFSDMPNEQNLGTTVLELSRHEEALKKAVEEGGLGTYGLLVSLTHGALVDACWKDQRIHPAETISIIYMNPDYFSGLEYALPSDRAVRDMAVELAHIKVNEQAVWVAAGQSPFALRFYEQVPGYANDLFREYGADQIQLLIYSNFDDPDVVVGISTLSENAR
jgi:hypothetical protein